MMEVKGRKYMLEQDRVYLTIEMRDGSIIEVKDFWNMSSVLSDMSRKLMFINTDKQMINSEEIKCVTIL